MRGIAPPEAEMPNTFACWVVGLFVTMTRVDGAACGAGGSLTVVGWFGVATEKELGLPPHPLKAKADATVSDKMVRRCAVVIEILTGEESSFELTWNVCLFVFMGREKNWFEWRPNWPGNGTGGCVTSPRVDSIGLEAARGRG